MGVERERERYGLGKSWRAKSVPGVYPNLSHGTKNTTHKESSREKSHVRGRKFNGRPKLPGWLGKRGHSRESGPGVAFIEGEG
jgi:hypothetical protein